MSTKKTPADKSAEAVKSEKKYHKTGNLPNGEWTVKDVATGEEKPASKFGDVTAENTLVD
jgi:hypothetical protein